MKTVNVHEAKTHLSRILEEVRAGEVFVLAKHGKPYAKLVPIDRGVTKRELGFMKIKTPKSFFEALPQTELSAWE